MKSNLTKLAFLTALLLAPLAAVHASEPVVSLVAPDATFSQIAQPSGFTPEMPKLSDVCMRLFRLDSNGVSAERILAAGDDFHITRGVWSYIEDKAFINRVRAKGWEFQATLNLAPGDPALALHDREGKPIRGNVLRNSKLKLLRDSSGNVMDDGKSPFRADLANPEFRRIYLERANRLVDLGVTSFQRDDPDEGHFDWGGQGNREGRRDAIPEADLLEFHRWARTEIEKHAGRKLTFFGANAMKVMLRVPLPYDAALHEQAEKDKNYRAIIRETPLNTNTEGDWTLVTIPALNPWGILVVEKMQ